MLRPFLYEIVLFVLPSLIYAIFLLWRGRGHLGLDAWDRAPLLTLVTLGVASVGIGLALFAHFGGAPAGTPYVPAHMENGKLIEPETR
jgi:Family of unknown function (DUF6111)